jgi:hypothetical protein
MHQPSSNNRAHRLRCTIITCALVAACYQAMLLDALAQTLPVGNPLRVQGDSSAELKSTDSNSGGEGGQINDLVQLDDLVHRATRLADRFDRLELLAGRLSELSRTTQPRRAKLLRELISQSHDQDLQGRFHRIIDSLQDHSLSAAHGQQLELQIQLHKLLQLLLREDRDRQIDSQRKRIQKYLGDIKRLIRLQRGLKGRTDGGGQVEQLSSEQQQIARRAEKLQQDITAQEGLVQIPHSPAGAKPGNDQNQGQDGQSKNKADPSQRRDGQSQRRDGQDLKKERSQKGGDQKQSESSESPSDPSSQETPKSGESPSGEPSPGKPGSDKPGAEGEQGGEGQEGAGAGTDNPPQATPMQRAQQKIKKAQQKMQAAGKKLAEAQRSGATEQQEKALRELEQAKAELERILRQLREEELERTLVMLEARFRKMLAMQIKVHEQTQRLDSKKSAEATAVAGVHEVEIASGRLSRQQRQIVQEADRAMILLREDGSSVAFPEALGQAREDMQSVADRLSQVRLGPLTQSLEEDIIAALEESLAALQQAIKKMRDSQGKSESGEGQSEQALVDQLAELRMIRSLQQRVNRKTDRYDKLIAGEQITAVEIVTVLDQLASREARIYEATHDLHMKKNQ